MIVHIIDTTKNREPWLQDSDLLSEMYAYNATILKDEMELKLTNDTVGIDESTRPPFRTTPAGFLVNGLLATTQGCATFVLLTSLHPGLT